MSTPIVSTIARTRELVGAARRADRSIGCVPTMGALHAGHGALIDRARSESDVVVVTIFVNPMQFDRKDDYDRYARNLEADRAFCAARNVDLIFAPSVEEMYPQPSDTFVDVPDLARYLCGAFRPGHFRGVATVVTKLFNIIQPDAAYFGEKDAQQLAIIEKMVHDLNFPVKVVPVPTVRERDGLALSSRNERLSPMERQIAPVLFRALTAGQCIIGEGERRASEVKAAALEVLAAEPDVRVEYLDVVDSRMQPVNAISTGVRLVAAVWIGSTRLIDNIYCPV